MNEFIKKLQALIPEIDNERGHLVLFALFANDDAPSSWDIVVCAKWAEVNQRSALDYLAGKLTKLASKGELALVARIVILERSNPVTNAILAVAEIAGGVFHVRSSNFNGLLIKDAYILRSQRDPSPPAAKPKLARRTPPAPILGQQTTSAA